ncbi:PrgI family protein [Enterococcus sp. AZ196]|uniref:PrgI family protein n=1 Tax=Enterococcus sp. AZ196 TaxID=2774659 RepID=UPI003D2A9DA8
MNNNSFVVTIPKDLKKVKAKLLFGLTKRQAIGFGIAILIGIPIFLLLKDFSLDAAMYGLLISAAPIIFGTLYQKNNMVSETWIKLYLEYTYLNPLKRYYKVCLKNKLLAKARRMTNAKKKKQKFVPSSTLAS